MRDRESWAEMPGVLFRLEIRYICLVWRIKGKIFLFLAAGERANSYEVAYKKGYYTTVICQKIGKIRSSTDKFVDL